MQKLPRPVRNLLTGGVLLTPSGIFTFVGCLQPEMSWVERQATIWEMLQHESRPESPLSPPQRQAQAPRSLPILPEGFMGLETALRLAHDHAA
jgi:hypothetical protein